MRRRTYRRILCMAGPLSRPGQVLPIPCRAAQEWTSNSSVTVFSFILKKTSYYFWFMWHLVCNQVSHESGRIFNEKEHKLGTVCTVQYCEYKIRERNNKYSGKDRHKQIKFLRWCEGCTLYTRAATRESLKDCNGIRRWCEGCTLYLRCHKRKFKGLQWHQALVWRNTLYTRAATRESVKDCNGIRRWHVALRSVSVSGTINGYACWVVTKILTSAN